MVAEIYPTDSSGNPDTHASPLGTGSTPSSSIIPERAQWVNINLSQGAQVSQGTLYALVLHTVDANPNNPGFAGYLSWPGTSSGPDHYTMGSGNYGMQDYFFKTFVSTPTSASPSDTQAPTVKSLVATNRTATGEPRRNTNFLATFSEPMNKSTLNNRPSSSTGAPRPPTPPAALRSPTRRSRLVPTA